jgi:hypothetical protein
MQLNPETKKYTKLTLLTLLNAPILYPMGSWVVGSIDTVIAHPKTQFDDLGMHDMFVTEATANTVMFLLFLFVFVLALINRKWAVYLNLGLCTILYGAVLYGLILK